MGIPTYAQKSRTNVLWRGLPAWLCLALLHVRRDFLFFSFSFLPVLFGIWLCGRGPTLLFERLDDITNRLFPSAKASQLLDLVDVKFPMQCRFGLTSLMAVSSSIFCCKLSKIWGCSMLFGLDAIF